MKSWSARGARVGAGHCIVGALAWVLVGCTSDGSDDTASDASESTLDASGSDGSPSADTSTDAASDGPVDATVGVTGDAASDATVDPSIGISVDASMDASVDASADASGASPCTTAILGPAGGSVVHPLGAIITVPVGALAASTQLSLCPETSPAGAINQAFQAGPEGQTFLKPVDVAIRFDPTLVASGTDLTTIQMRMAPQGMSSYVALQSNVALVTGLVHASTTHFTQFVPEQSQTPIFIASSAALPQATLGIAYAEQLSASGGTAPYTWIVASSSLLPPGLALSPAGLLSGTPTLANNFAFFVAVSDSAQNTVEMAASLTIVPPSNPSPVLGSLAPSSVAQGSENAVIVLSGTGFVPTSQALWDGTPIPTAFVGSTQVAASIPAAALLTAGSHQVSIFNPSPGGGTSAASAFTVTPAAVNPAPSVTSVAPTLIPIGSAAVQVTITGSNFNAGSLAAIDTEAIATNYVSPTQLLAVIPASFLMEAGALPISVYNPAPGGGFSPMWATVNVGTPNPIPTITALAPTTVSTGYGDFVLAISGTPPPGAGFLPGAQAFFGSTALATSYVSQDLLQATVPAYLVVNPSSVQVIVVNPAPGGGPSAAVTFVTTSSSPDDGGAASESGVGDGSVILLSGGISNNNSTTHYFDDTWEWNGASWTSISGLGPSGREGSAAATVNGTVVMYGGFNDTDWFAETWEWSASTWTQLMVPDPGARGGASAAALNGNLVLFGGLSLETSPVEMSVLVGDTWQWDGSTWTQVSTTGPTPREGAAMATLNGDVVLFGGDVDGATSLEIGDTWQWDGLTWTQVSTSGPTPREGAAMATLNGNVVLFGGYTQQNPDGGAAPLVTFFGDTWTWNGSTWTQVASSGPPPRCYAGAATLNGNVVLFGGEASDGSDLGDTWEWDGAKWTQVSDSGPAGRANAIMVGP